MALHVDGGPAPYAPVKPVVALIERYRDRGMVTPITQEVLIKSQVVTESLAPRTYQSLKLLDLIDEQGQPTTALKELATSPGPEFKERAAALVRGAYAPIFSFADPATDSLEAVRDAFRGYEPRGQQERMVALFYGLCEFTGIVDEVPKRTAAQSAGTARSNGKAKKTGKDAGSARESAKVTVVAAGLPAPLQGLLNDLAAKGPTWTQTQRDQFLAVFNAVLDYSYPVQPDRAGDPDDTGGGES
jgi:hypothetical protein